MRLSMPEEPLIDSWFAYGYWKGLKEKLSPGDYAELVQRSNSRRKSGRRVSFEEELNRLLPIDDSKMRSRGDESSTSE